MSGRWWIHGLHYTILSIFIFDVFHNRTLKTKEGVPGLWVVSAHFLLPLPELTRLPLLSGLLTTWQGIPETTVVTTVDSEALSRQRRCEALLVNCVLLLDYSSIGDPHLAFWLYSRLKAHHIGKSKKMMWLRICEKGMKLFMPQALIL